jgi:hypothetical protein
VIGTKQYGQADKPSLSTMPISTITPSSRGGAGEPFVARGHPDRAPTVKSHSLDVMENPGQPTVKRVLDGEPGVNSLHHFARTFGLVGIIAS